MEDYIRAGLAFGHMYFSLVLGMWAEREEDEEYIGKLLATWFTVLNCRYAYSKTVHMGEVDWIYRASLNYWSAFLFITLWRKAFAVQNSAELRMWLIMWSVSMFSVGAQLWMTNNYEEFDAELIWENEEVVQEGVFTYMSYLFILTYISLIYRFDKPVLVLWTFMLADALVIFEPIGVGKQLMM